MASINIEIKARTDRHEEISVILKSKNADFKGVDNQIDTYFKVGSGRLKLREGNIENQLIYYKRENTENPKQSDVILFKTDPGSSLKEILKQSLGILVVVEKKREIYFIDNVKFHLDYIEGLGTFVEIEAIDTDGTIGKEKLSEQCNYYLDLLQIPHEDMIPDSYSDLLIKLHK